MGMPWVQDLLVKNIKRHLRQARREGSDLQALDFLPTTYILPQVGPLLMAVMPLIKAT